MNRECIDMKEKQMQLEMEIDRKKIRRMEMESEINKKTYKIERTENFDTEPIGDNETAIVTISPARLYISTHRYFLSGEPEIVQDEIDFTEDDGYIPSIEALQLTTTYAKALKIAETLGFKPFLGSSYDIVANYNDGSTFVIENIAFEEYVTKEEFEWHEKNRKNDSPEDLMLGDDVN